MQAGQDDGTRIEVLSPLRRDVWIITKCSSVVEIGDEVQGVPVVRP